MIMVVRPTTSTPPAQFVSAQSNIINGTSAVNWTFTTTAKGVVLVGISGDVATANVNSMTIGSRQMSLIGTSTVASGSRSDLLAISDVEPGTYNMSLNFSRATGGTIITSSYIGRGVDRASTAGGNASSGVMQAGSVILDTDKELAFTTFCTYSQAGGNVQVGTFRHAADVTSSWGNGYHQIIVDSKGPGTFRNRAVMTNQGGDRWESVSARIF